MSSERMAETLNQAIADRLVRRQLQVGRVETALRAQVLDELRMLAQEILAAVRREDPTDAATLAQQQRAVRLLMNTEITLLVEARYAIIAALVREAMHALALAEATFLQETVNDEADDALIDDTPPEEAITRRVDDALIPTATAPTDLSATATEWWERQAVGLTTRLGDQMLVSVALSEPLQAMVARIRGTAEQAYQDGIMAKAGQDAQRLLRTEATSALTLARALTLEAAPRIGMVQHSSVLDGRTSTVCLARHGLVYVLPEYQPLGHRIPYLTGAPYHPSCRSTIVPLVRGQGRVAVEDVRAWFVRQSPTLQQELVGPTRARMVREGALTPRQLLDAATGQPLTLEELRS